MVAIVLVSHGTLCEGMLDTLIMVGGEDFGIKAVPLSPGTTPEDYRENLRSTLSPNVEDETLIFSDIRGGTPYQSALYLAKKYKLAVIAGMNLPMILSTVMGRTAEMSLNDLARNAVQSENQGIYLEYPACEEGVKKRRAKLSIDKD